MTRLMVRGPNYLGDYFEVSAGVLDEAMCRYRNLCEDHGFSDINREDIYNSKNLEAAMFSNVIVNTDFERLMLFLRECET
jgi:hypothetical protein